MRTKITFFVFVGVCCAICFAAHAQGQTISSTTVQTNPPGFWVTVDGTRLQAPQTMLWPEGSKHTLTADTGQAGQNCLAYNFKGWTEPSGLLQTGQDTTIVVTANASLKTFVAQYEGQRTVYLRLGSPTPDVNAVIVNGVTYHADTDLSVAPGAPLKLQAVPGPGFVFTEWSADAARTSSFLLELTPTGCLTIAAMFAPSRPILIQTNPTGLTVLADRTLVRAPQTLDWAVDSVHNFAAISPQSDANGRIYAFQSWSDGGAYQHSYIHRGGSMQAAEVTANYVRAAGVTLTTNIPGLKLTVDGHPAAADYNAYWGVGETHTFSAPAEQRDALGRLCTFESWSNGETGVQTVTVTEDHLLNGIRLNATYKLFGLISVDTYPSGMNVEIDGRQCQTPCQVDRPVGTRVAVTAPSSIEVSDGVRLQLSRPVPTITASEQVQKVNIDYQRMYRLTYTSDPTDAINWRFDQQPDEGYYPAQAAPLVTADSRSGYKFLKWAGDAAGINKSVTVLMDAPHRITAIADRVPYVDPAGVKNAAGDTPELVVAPGSMVAIHGASLAETSDKSSSSMLVQTLGNVTVRWDQRLLPLFSISPEMILVQLPSDMPEGAQTLTVRLQGKDDVQAPLQASRNAPGLFQKVSDDIGWAYAAHADGTPITVENPAKHGEIISVYGTGFGPYDRSFPDGFAVPEGTQLNLADPVEILAGDLQISPLSATAAVGRIAVNVVQFPITNDFPASSNIQLTVRVNGRRSNTVLLPVE